MNANLVTLLGVDRPEPKQYEIKAVSPEIVMGISSVVDKTWKTHNLINNEDACGTYLDDHLRLVMVADSHDGYVSSHEAVKRFPGFLKERLSLESPEQVMQTYLESVIAFYEELSGIGRKSGIIYEREGVHSIEDFSSTTFHSIVNVAGDYYVIDCGDSYTAIISGEKLEVIKPRCGFFLGTSRIREKIVESYFEYERKYRAIVNKYRAMESSNQTHEDAVRLWERESTEQTELSHELQQVIVPNYHHTRDYVRKVIPIHKLKVKKGDIIFQCTDGIELDREGSGEKVPSRFITKCFSGRSIYEGIERIFQGIQRREFSIEMDNVAITALLVR